ncbi:MAG TPA: nickel pincer cofactor biosynthesis protein LarC [Thermoguttaceae bacterium]|nr:nickel pincer cofactor biosynthesis protein LarC [Thermoguttaceae bacterium]
MRIAYLDCASGVSGDMILGALVDAGVEIDALNEVLGSLKLGDCRLTATEVRRCGFRATQVVVHASPAARARHLPEILELVGRGDLDEGQKHRVERIFRRLAEAEARVHGIPIDKVHFHELGAVDTIADVVGAVLGFDLLGVERIVVSPIPTGSGRIKMAHGLVSVPAPATAELLRGVPLAGSTVEAELTTPTGAAVVTTLAEGFGSPPAMTLQTIGCGAGGRDLAEQPNVLRVLIGLAVEPVPSSESLSGSEEVCLLETNLDDTPGEWVGYCVERLREAGALDVWTTAVGMKKNRPGVLISALCRPEDVAALEGIFFVETTTLGVRRQLVQRRCLPREVCEVTTAWGPIEGKVRRLPDGRTDFAPEYESCRRIAERRGVALREVYAAAQKAFTRDAAG